MDSTETGTKGIANLSPLELSKKQRSHVLLVFSNAKAGRETEIENWYRGAYRGTVSAISGVLSTHHYEKSEIDMTGGDYPPPPFKYLGIHDLSVDGAEAVGPIIDRILALHAEFDGCESVATWLYYPIGEKVGRAPASTATQLTIAFANSVPGRELEFREWYVTRHIRHALNLRALVSGQCFERALYQKCGSIESSFSMIALYDQEGSAQSIVEDFNSLPPSTFAFPAMSEEKGRFGEGSYRKL